MFCCAEVDMMWHLDLHLGKLELKWLSIFLAVFHLSIYLHAPRTVVERQWLQELPTVFRKISTWNRVSAALVLWWWGGWVWFLWFSFLGRRGLWLCGDFQIYIPPPLQLYFGLSPLFYIYGPSNIENDSSNCAYNLASKHVKPGKKEPCQNVF